MAARGQIIPLSSIRGKQDPIDIFMASMEVLHTVDKKNPKLIPAKPWTQKITIASECKIVPWNKVRMINQATGPRHGSWNMRNTVTRVMAACSL